MENRTKAMAWWNNLSEEEKVNQALDYGRPHFSLTGREIEHLWRKANSTHKYLRLLSYDNACKVIAFINSDQNNYANITPGGVSMQVFNENWEKVENFIKSLGVRYEIGTEAPHKVTERIVRDLRDKGIIE